MKFLQARKHSQSGREPDSDAQNDNQPRSALGSKAKKVFMGTMAIFRRRSKPESPGPANAASDLQLLNDNGNSQTPGIDPNADSNPAQLSGKYCICSTCV